MTNGLGGFAMGTVVGCNTRRYHGLLCAATLPPVGRMMTLNRVGEILYLDGATDRMLELSVNQFQGNLHPRGDRYLRRFELDDVARWEYEVEGVRVVKELQLCGRRTWPACGTGRAGRRAAGPAGPAAVRAPARLPLPAPRRRRNFDVRGERRPAAVARGAQRPSTSAPTPAGSRAAATGGTATCTRSRPSAARTTPKTCSAPAASPSRRTGRPASRSGPSIEPLVHSRTGTSSSAGATPSASSREARAGAASTAAGSKLAAAAATRPDEPPPRSSGSLRAAERLRRLPQDPGRHATGTTVIAGYPWFADWGRDTMISLPGLLLVTGRFEEAETGARRLRPATSARG